MSLPTVSTSSLGCTRPHDSIRLILALALFGTGIGLSGCGAANSSSTQPPPQPLITLSPSLLVFPATNVGVAAASLPITVSNPGSAALSINTIAITGGNATSFSQSNNCSTSLASGSSCTINVSFIPTLSGTLTAGISITDNAVGSPHIASLAGAGSVAGTPQVIVGGAGQVRLGSTAQFTATVTNESNTTVTWQVNGVTGGAASTGTISATGLYTPPTSIPAVNPVTITAVSVAAPSVVGAASEIVWNPIPAVASGVATVNYGATSGLLTVTGSGFVTGAQILVGGVATSTTFVSPTTLQAAAAPIAAGATTLAIAVSNPNPGSVTTPTANAQVQTSLQSAARLLDQATFGPTLADIQTVQSEGLQAYLTAQFATPTTLEPDITNPPPQTLCATNLVPCQQGEWWQNAITGPDQLRQRVALALSEMFVVSTNSLNARAVTTYQNTLANDAFLNFLTTMHDVTLSPAMGAYLNMLHSAKPALDPITHAPLIANENFAREEMQLFSIGLDMLNPDGTPQLDGGGNPIPTYTEAQVQAFARAYTGWTYANATGGSPTSFPNYTANYDFPMAPVESQHDMLAKVLLNGTTLPAGQTAENDLSGALSNIFNHPNVGPFVCRQLIQHLVTSNPSPAYVARVAAVFANDGTGTRGNMQAVIKAILLDTEARAGDTNPSFDGGHLREPLLYMANVIRGLGFTFNCTGSCTGPEYYSVLSNYTTNLSQKPYTSGSVFNFFPPEYVIPGTTTNAPEFGLENTASAVLRLTLADQLVNNKIQYFSVDLSATSPLGIMASATGNPATDSANLVTALSNLFMHGQMPAQMQNAIVTHVATLSNIPERVRVATYLTLTSSLYKVEH